MMSKVKVALATTQCRISILDITMYQAEFKNLVKQKFNLFFREYLLSIKQFIISTIKDNDDNLKKLSEVKKRVLNLLLVF